MIDHISFEDNPQTYNGFICNGTKDLGSAVMYGLIRSHSKIPWDYDGNTFIGSLVNGVRIANCTKTLHLQLGSNERFAVSVPFVDVDDDNDKLSINGYVVHSGTSYQRTISSHDGKIVFNFITHSATTKGGSGFVICFKSKICLFLLKN